MAIELLGELVHAYPDKKLAIQVRGDRLLPGSAPKVSQIA